MRKERLYLTSWEYNASLTLQELRKIVINNGGELVSSYKMNDKKIYEVSNRTLSEAIYEKEERHQKMLNRGRTITNEALDELERIKAINNDPVLIDDSLTYISFILDDIYYYISLNDNPFFPFHYSKIKVNDYSYSGDYYCDEFSKDWLYDCMLSYKCNDDERLEIAYLIYNQLLTSSMSKKHIERTKKRVPNYYDGGYHYEYITQPERKHQLYKLDEMEG